MMSTIFVTIKNGKVAGIATSTDPSTAQRQLFWTPGEMYACRISDTAAAEVRELMDQPEGNVKRGVAQVTPLTLLKRYSQSMQKVADIT